MNRLLVTGIGRSGTKYMAELLTAAGIECGHETLFPTDTKAVPAWGNAVAESAWPAAPWLGEMRALERDGKVERFAVVHLVRHPLDWIASWSQTVWANPHRTRSTRYICKHTGVDWFERIEQDVLSASAQLWVHWNRLVEPYANARLQVEEIGPAELAMLCGLMGHEAPSEQALAEALEKVPRNVNARPHGVVFWDDLGEEPYFRHLAREYGYAPPSFSDGAGI